MMLMLMVMVTMMMLISRLTRPWLWTSRDAVIAVAECRDLLALAGQAHSVKPGGDADDRDGGDDGDDDNDDDDDEEFGDGFTCQRGR